MTSRTRKTSGAQSAFLRSKNSEQRNTDIPSVAVYCRFSKDEGKAGDSSSIETQKEMLTQYVRNQGWRLYDIYVEACDIIEPTQKASNIKGFWGLVFY